MRMILSAALAVAIFGSNALAEDAANSLSPGKPAGVKAAQGQAVNPIIYLGLVGIAGIVVIATGHSSHNGSGSSSTTTTTTGTSP